MRLITTFTFLCIVLLQFQLGDVWARDAAYHGASSDDGRLDSAHMRDLLERANAASMAQGLTAEKMHEQLDQATRLQRDLQVCSTLPCNAQKLSSLVGEFSSLREGLSSGLEPINIVFTAVQVVNDGLTKAENLRSTLKIFFDVAQQIPFVGPLFSFLSQALEALKIPLDLLRNALSTPTTTVIKPWNTAVENTLGRMEGVEDVVIDGADKVTDIGEALEQQCIGAVVKAAVPAFKPIYNSLESVVANVVSAMETIVPLMKNLALVMAGAAWTTIQTALTSLTKVVGILFSPLEELDVLTKLFDEEISIPWPGNIKDKQNSGIPNSCPDGMSKSSTGLLCRESCGSGWGGLSDFLCQQDCPGGYTDLGAVCKNKYYKVRKVKVAAKCGKKYQRIAGVCVKKCDDDWKSGTVGKVLRVCYKECPSGFTLDEATYASCIPPTRRRATSALQCKPGFDLIEGFCLKECKDDETDGRYFCFKQKEVSFTINEIKDKVEGIIDKIRGLPILSTIENAIKTAVKTVLSSVLDFIGLPGVDDLPGVPSISLSSFPILDLSTNFINFPSFDPANLLEQLPMGNPLGNVLKKLGIDDITSLLDCGSDALCYADELGLDAKVPTGFVDKARAIMDTPDLFKLFAEFAMNIDGCRTWKNITIPFVSSVADLMGVNDVEACDTTFEMCTELNINDSVMDNLVNKFRQLVGTFIDEVSSLLDGGRRLRAERNLLSFDKDNFEIPFPGFPVAKIFPTFEYFKNGKENFKLGWLFGQKIEVGETSHLGYKFTTDVENTKLVMVMGKSNGKFFIRLDMKAGIQFGLKTFQGNLASIWDNAVYFFWQNVYEYAGRECVDVAVTVAGDPILKCIPESSTRAACIDYCGIVSDVVFSTTCETDEQTARVKELLKISDENDPFWKTDEAFERVEEGITCLKYRLKKLTSYYTNNIVGWLSARWWGEAIADNFLNLLITAIREPAISINIGPPVDSDVKMDLNVKFVYPNPLLIGSVTDSFYTGGTWSTGLAFNLADFTNNDPVNRKNAFKGFTWGFNKALTNLAREIINPRTMLDVKIGPSVYVKLKKWVFEDVNTPITSSPTMSPTDAPTTSSPTVSPTHIPTASPTIEVTEQPTSIHARCVHLFDTWQTNNGFTCAQIEALALEDAFCQIHSSPSQTNMGYNIEEVCCFCGGGRIEDTCTDLYNGDWLDANGNGCGLYDNDPEMCGEITSVGLHGIAADKACCACGGGCQDSIQGWEDDDGHNCRWYGEDPATRCSPTPDSLFNTSSKSVCCACKAGRNHGECTDFTVTDNSNNQVPWDDGTVLDPSTEVVRTCAWYATQGPQSCVDYQDVKNYNINAMFGCCTCGGGFYTPAYP